MRWSPRLSWLGAALLGCSSSGADVASPEDTETAGAEDSGSTTVNDAGPTSGAVSTTATSEGATNDSSSSTSASPTSGESSSSEGNDDSSSGGTVAPGTGCPERLPAEWILCEDFETFAGWGNFWTNDASIAVEAGPAISGETSLRISHVEGQYGSGMADLRFGGGPSGGTIYAPDETFREVWVRFFLRTHEDWPADRGISEAVEIMSVVGGNRSIAVDATIYSASAAEARVLPWSCVHDSQLLCSSGNSDWSGSDLRPLADVSGPSALYGDERAGQWQCHEMRVRLDQPGRADGEVDLWVDGALEVAIDGLEFVGSWAGAGLNTVRFASFWNDQVGLDHHVDDVIVSTAPIGCPEPTD